MGQWSWRSKRQAVEAGLPRRDVSRALHVELCLPARRLPQFGVQLNGLAVQMAFGVLDHSWLLSARLSSLPKGSHTMRELYISSKAFAADSCAYLEQRSMLPAASRCSGTPTVLEGSPPGKHVILAVSAFALAAVLVVLQLGARNSARCLALRAPS